MASSEAYAKFIVDQAREAVVLTYRKMFGEYGIYCDGVFIALLCDDRLFCKITGQGQDVLLAFGKETMLVPPYQGAKPIFLIEDVEDAAFLSALFSATKQALESK